MKKAPAIKLLLALTTGIIIQWYLQFEAIGWVIFLGICFAGLASSFFLPLYIRLKLSAAIGIVMLLNFVCAGALLARQKDIRNNNSWFGRVYQPGDYLIVQLAEPLIEKPRSMKAVATARYIIRNGHQQPVSGKINLYFSKDSLPSIPFGSLVIVRKNPDAIRDAGNPGGFDYSRYALFQGITAQLFLKANEFVVLDTSAGSVFKKWMYRLQQKVLTVLQKNIAGEKERGLAEALLIGYKNDLDRSLVQSYSNTGVVHIIAISGLHLGLIYWLLSLLLTPLQSVKRLRPLRVIIILSCLWIFSLLAGAQPSILRSAIMFSCIVIGESFSRKASVFNTLAVSAIILLFINPYWLWDIGFQLSYAAVLSIILFMRPVYNLFYIKNKWLDMVWKMNAVTIGAQVLTIPLTVYHFHQFPNLFLLTNMVAIPLSSLILLVEIGLCAFAFIPALATVLGVVTTWLIQFMNFYIERMESIPFFLWDGLQISLAQCLLLFLFIICVCYWLSSRSFNMALYGLASLLGFAALRAVSFAHSEQQQKLIVYNIPSKKAMDLIEGRNHRYIGDSDVVKNSLLYSFYIRASRILFRAQKTMAPEKIIMHNNCIQFHDKHVLLLNNSGLFAAGKNPPIIDLAIISNNTNPQSKNLFTTLAIKKCVFDATVPLWKLKRWKERLDSLHIPWHDVSTQGAFVMNLR